MPHDDDDDYIEEEKYHNQRQYAPNLFCRIIRTVNGFLVCACASTMVLITFHSINSAFRCILASECPASDGMPIMSIDEFVARVRVENTKEIRKIEKTEEVLFECKVESPITLTLPFVEGFKDVDLTGAIISIGRGFNLQISARSMAIRIRKNGKIVSKMYWTDINNVYISKIDAVDGFRGSDIMFTNLQILQKIGSNRAWLDNSASVSDVSYDVIKAVRGKREPYYANFGLKCMPSEDIRAIAYPDDVISELMKKIDKHSLTKMCSNQEIRSMLRGLGNGYECNPADTFGELMSKLYESNPDHFTEIYEEIDLHGMEKGQLFPKEIVELEHKCYTMAVNLVKMRKDQIMLHGKPLRFERVEPAPQELPASAQSPAPEAEAFCTFKCIVL